MRRLALQGGARVRTQHRYHDNGVHEEADGGHPLVVSYKFCWIEIGFGWCNGGTTGIRKQRLRLCARTTIVG